jgi:simple sugar transport system permease protein
VGGDSRRAAFFNAGRATERLPGAAHRPAIVHHHARHSIHSSRHDHRLDLLAHRVDQTAGYSLAHTLFAGKILIGGVGFPVDILWAAAVVVVATWLLLGTPFGNWIFGVGGESQAARNVGVPVRRVKLLLFVGTAVFSCLLAIIQVVTFTSSQVLLGQGNEFQAIVAAVIGGVLLTGGYGSAVGAMFGALIFGIVQQGIVFAGVDANWYKAFVGVILLLAVLLNTYVRKLAMEKRR